MWGVSAVTLCLSNLWGGFSQLPLILHVTAVLVAAASVTILFTHLPSLLRKLISPWVKSRFVHRRWVQIANLTNVELQQRALETVGQIRDVLEQYGRDEHLQNNAPMFPPGASTVAKNLLHQEHSQGIVQRSNHFISNYKRQFQVDAILIRDEMRKRLHDPEEDTGLGHTERLYENPVNSLDVEDVVRDLESLAKRLPTKDNN
jgi:hypothetical protein